MVDRDDNGAASLANQSPLQPWEREAMRVLADSLVTRGGGLCNEAARWLRKMTDSRGAAPSELPAIIEEWAGVIRSLMSLPLTEYPKALHVPLVEAIKLLRKYGCQEALVQPTHDPAQSHASEEQL